MRSALGNAASFSPEGLPCPIGPDCTHFLRYRDVAYQLLAPAARRRLLTERGVGMGQEERVAGAMMMDGDGGLGEAGLSYEEVRRRLDSP